MPSRTMFEQLFLLALAEAALVKVQLARSWSEAGVGMAPTRAPKTLAAATRGVNDGMLGKCRGMNDKN